MWRDEEALPLLLPGGGWLVTNPHVHVWRDSIIYAKRCACGQYRVSTVVPYPPTTPGPGVADVEAVMGACGHFGVMRGETCHKCGAEVR